jgi:hypothetical protein
MNTLCSPGAPGPAFGTWETTTHIYSASRNSIYVHAALKQFFSPWHAGLPITNCSVSTPDFLEIPGEIAPELKKNQFKDRLPLSACCPNHGVFGVSRCFACAKRPGHDNPGGHWDHH